MVLRFIFFVSLSCVGFSNFLHAAEKYSPVEMSLVKGTLSLKKAKRKPYLCITYTYEGQSYTSQTALSSISNDKGSPHFFTHLWTLVKKKLKSHVRLTGGSALREKLKRDDENFPRWSYMLTKLKIKNKEIEKITGFSDFIPRKTYTYSNSAKKRKRSMETETAEEVLKNLKAQPKLLIQEDSRLPEDNAEDESLFSHSVTSSESSSDDYE
jgi:hypothetical protein